MRRSNLPVKLSLTQLCEISHFVRNDNHVVIVGVRLVCGKAANQPHSPPTFANVCHSERSEES